VFAGGIHWAEVLTHWLEYKPNDPLNNLGASFHAYQGNTCSSPTCYDRDLARVVAQVPLFVGEVGSDTPLDADCKLSAVGNTGFSKATFDWLDAKGRSYTAWSWNQWKDCWSLIARFDGTPTPRWGQAVKAASRPTCNRSRPPSRAPDPDPRRSGSTDYARPRAGRASNCS
jgi:endoglucanase